MTINEIIKSIEEVAPLSLQEAYDNAGLIVGNPKQECSAALITLDITEDVIDEAIQKKANLIISHHPIVFGGLKKITGRNMVERCVIKAIKNDIALYAAHTNLDNVLQGVNGRIAQKLGLKNCKILAPKQGELRKLVTFVPKANAQKVRLAIFEAGAGHIGEYDQCSYNVEGKGTFRASENANPYVGNIGELHVEEEIRIETVYPKMIENKVLAEMFKAHPYEEVAYDIYPLQNKWETTGSGMIGELPEAIPAMAFLQKVKDIFAVGCVKYTKPVKDKIKKVAFCGGSGSFLINNAIRNNADIFMTGDIKYHQFFDAENKIIIADIGHFESEQYTKEIFYDILKEKMPNFVRYLSETNTNPINYL